LNASELRPPAGQNLRGERRQNQVVSRRLLRRLPVGCGPQAGGHLREELQGPDAPQQVIIRASGVAHDVPPRAVCRPARHSARIRHHVVLHRGDGTARGGSRGRHPDDSARAQRGSGRGRWGHGAQRGRGTTTKKSGWVPGYGFQSGRYKT